MEKARLILKCKDDKTYLFVSAMLDRKFYSILLEDQIKDEPQEPPKLPIPMRAVHHLKEKIENFLSVFDKEMRQAIKEERVTIDAEPHDKGGIIIIKMVGTKEELDEWLKIRWRDKIGLKAIKKWVELNVER